MSFWKRHKEKEKEFLNSNEFETLSKKITNLSNEIDNISHKIKLLQQDQDNLRGNFNRKLKGIAEEEKKNENPLTTSKSLNPFSPFNI